MTLKLASKNIIQSFKFDPQPIYQNPMGDLSIHRVIRQMPNGNVCQFLLYRIPTDKTYSQLNIAIQSKVDFLKVNQLHIINEKTMPLVITTLRSKDHNYILKCCSGFFATPFNTLEYWLISEYSTNTTLFSYMNKNEPFFYDEILIISYQLVKILNYAYIEFRMPYIHLIPQNIFLGKNPSSPFPQAKLSPYAFIPHNGFHPQEEQGFLPNDYFNAIRKESVSIFSFGVILFKMMTGILPQINNEGIIEKSELEKIPLKESVDLIWQCINIPMNRPSIETIRGHQFIRRSRQHGKLQQTENQYEILKEIGKGQFGKVLLGINKSTGEKVAIKESVGNQISYLQKDARTMLCCSCDQLVSFKGYFVLNQCLSHSVSFSNNSIQTFLSHQSVQCQNNQIMNNYQQSYQQYNNQMNQYRNNQNTQTIPTDDDNSMIEEEEQYCYLVMEYCDGGNLEEFINNFNGLLPELLIQHFIGDIAIGLHYLHFTKGLVHRDLKPENFVLVTQSRNGQLLPNEIPRIKITDYGFSRAILDDKINSEKGTVLFEAPEILRHEGYYSSKSDLYSVGVIIYHLVTKMWPFTNQKESFLENMSQRRNVYFPENIPINPLLKELMINLITHDENQRMDWNEFFQHQYIQQCIHLKNVSFQ